MRHRARHLGRSRAARRPTAWFSVANESAGGSAFLAVSNAGMSKVACVQLPSVNPATGTPPPVEALSILAVKGHITWRNLNAFAATVRAGLVVLQVDASGIPSAADLVQFQVFGNSGLEKAYGWMDQRRIQQEVGAAALPSPSLDPPTMTVDMRVKRKLKQGQALYLLLETDAAGFIGAQVNVRSLISRVA